MSQTKQIALVWFAVLAAFPAYAQDSVDYVLPTLDNAARIQRLVPGDAARDGQAVEYTSFNGTKHTLKQYDGKYVTLLLPDAWLPPSGLSEAQRRVAIDRADHLYDINRTLYGREPSGAGKTIIAVVPTCGAGCGQLGAKGIELAPDQYNVDAFKTTGDAPTDVLIHEMNHNFDLYFRHHGYVPDAAHAWTFLMDAAVPAVMRTSVNDPVSRLQKYLYGPDARYDRYLTTATATWRTCIDRDTASCPFNITALWGAIAIRTLELHGVTALKPLLDYWRTWTTANAPPSSTEGKADLQIAVLSDAVAADLTCYVEAWKWSASTALRATMAGRGVNPRCLDADVDGFRPFDGDLDDGNPAQYPGAPETANGVDDDGNGAIDDLPLVEPAGGDFVPFQAVGSAVRIDGALTAGDDDRFRLTVASRSLVRFRLTSKSTFRGWLFVYNPNGSWLKYVSVGAGGQSILDVELAAGTWTFSVSLNVESTPGDYRVHAYSVAPWPANWGRATVAAGSTPGSVALGAVIDNPAVLRAPATEMRFWVVGHGFVSTVPAAAVVTTTWTPPPGTDIRELFVRAQAFRDGLPVGDLTSPVQFAIVPDAPSNLLGVVSANTVSLAWKVSAGDRAPTHLLLDVAGAISTVFTLPVSDTISFAGVPPGSYTVSLRAANATGTSPSSNALTLTFPAVCSGPPLTPTSFVATRNGRRITVTWDLPLSGPAPTTYVVNVTGSFVGAFATAGRSLSGDAPPGTYGLSVSASNVCGTSAPTLSQTIAVP